MLRKRLSPPSLLLALSACAIAQASVQSTARTVRVYDPVGNPVILASAAPWDEAVVLPASSLRPSALIQASLSNEGAPDRLLLSGATIMTLTGSDFHALPHTTLTVTNGHSGARETYSGVPLIELLEKVGAPAPQAVKGKVLSDYIIATGSDNYHAVLALAEIEPGFHPGTVLVADTLNGKPLDTKEGPLKLIVEEDQKPARWVHNLVKVELKQAE